MPWYAQVLFVSQPLHFGNYGGLPLKVLWALLDGLAIVVLGSGVYLWLKKRNVTVDDWLRAARGDGAAGAEPEAALPPASVGQPAQS